jgi:hypothetical protein
MLTWKRGSRIVVGTKSTKLFKKQTKITVAPYQVNSKVGFCCAVCLENLSMGFIGGLEVGDL